jgi:hypothetical protein
MNHWNEVLDLVQEVVGLRSTLLENAKAKEVDVFEGDGIGYNQFNELLLLLGFERTSQELFQFLVDGTVEYKQKSTIKSIENLEEGVKRFIKFACLIYGNINTAFLIASSDSEEFVKWVTDVMEPINESDYKRRKKPILPIISIQPKDT